MNNYYTKSLESSNRLHYFACFCSFKWNQTVYIFFCSKFRSPLNLCNLFHIAACSFRLLILIAVQLYHNLFTYSMVNWHLKIFQFGTILYVVVL